MAKKPLYITAGELAERGPDAVDDTSPNCRLIYSAPGTLAYNSPGAYGFGVKRAALLLPESAMLLIAPGCCGRNSAFASSGSAYAGRMFYLQMDETDLVTGRHLEKISAAVREILRVAAPTPKAVLLCITCVDALLGTDLERVCRRAQEENGVFVVPTTMYAITREGRKPPMVTVRKALYSLLKPVDRPTENAVNLLGNFSPLEQGCELPGFLRQAGFNRVNQLSACRSFDEYLEMGGARLNLVLNPEARLAAEDLRTRLGTPYAELTRLYRLPAIKKQYALFAAALSCRFDDEAPVQKALAAVERFKARCGGMSFAVGQAVNADPFELALSLISYGMKVPVVFASPTEWNFPFLKQLAQQSPSTKIYSSLSPGMAEFGGLDEFIDIAVGQDAAYYCPGARIAPWNSERQPFGYAGLCSLLAEIEAVSEKPPVSWNDMFLSQSSKGGL